MKTADRWESRAPAWCRVACPDHVCDLWPWACSAASAAWDLVL